MVWLLVSEPRRRRLSTKNIHGTGEPATVMFMIPGRKLSSLFVWGVVCKIFGETLRSVPLASCTVSRRVVVVVRRRNKGIYTIVVVVSLEPIGGVVATVEIMMVVMILMMVMGRDVSRRRYHSVIVGSMWSVVGTTRRRG